MYDATRREYVLDRAQAEGRIVAASRAHWTGEYNANPAATEAVLATLAPMVGVLGHTAPGEPVQARHVHPVVPAAAVALTAEQVAEWSRELFPETVVATAAGPRSRISADASYARRSTV